ncbi:MAG: M1 family metallopeptidase, partial [Acidobacteriota bacterium]
MSMSAAHASLTCSVPPGDGRGAHRPGWPVLPGVLLVLLLMSLMGGASEAALDTKLEGLFNGFYRVKLETARSVPVKNLKIERDGLTLELASGRLWLSSPLGGRVTGAYFVGEGVATLTAHGQTGQNMLRATLSGKNAGVPFPGQLPKDAVLRPASGEKDFNVLKVKVTEIFFRFSDGFEEDLVPLLQEGGDGADEASKKFQKRNDAMFLMPQANLENDFIVQVTDDVDRYAFFVAEMKLGPQWLLFGNIGSRPEEIWMGTHPSIGGSQQRLYTWAACDREEDYDENGHWDGDLLMDGKMLYEITGNKMKIDLPSTASFHLDARITLSPLMEELTVVPFDLINNLGYVWNDPGGRPVSVESVADLEGHDLPFIHKRNKVLVRLPKPLAPGEEMTLRFQAEEKTIIQLSDESWNVVNTYPWFPQHGYLGGMYPIDWTFTIRKPLSVIASGTLLDKREEKNRTVTHWKFDQKVALASFIFGRFQELSGEYPSEDGSRKIALGVYANPTGRLRGTTKLKSVLAESKTILKLYEILFGPYPFDSLDITQMAPFIGFGQSPPGLLFLTGDAFLPTGLVTEIGNQSGFMKAPYFHAFFAHELGHQWWGHDVVWGREEDQWLSEAFTEYASALYAFQIDGDARFQEKLTDWKKNALQAEKSGFPIAASNMVTAKDLRVQGKYRTGLIYDKGAYVVHMLRMTIGHEKFMKAMRSFLTEYKGGMATTQMLKQEVEEVAGGSMDWFFDQWFYGSGTPTFKFSYETEKIDSGYLLTGHIVQDPSNFKQVLMPVFFDLGGKHPSIKNY